jgi:alcohol dehydrogenase class IV
MTAPRYSVGPGSIENLVQIKAEFNPKRTLLVTGRSSYAGSGAKAAIDLCFDPDEIVRFNEFETNPRLGDALHGTEIAIENQIDLILAVGGGSVMDMAKLIKAFFLDPQNAEAIARGNAMMQNPPIPLVCIPTTAGSGSEATQFAVVYIDKPVGKEKFSLVSPHLLPDRVILDGHLIASNSPYQKAVNGLDALAQAIEAVWANSSTKESRAYAFEAIASCMDTLRRLVKSDAGSTDGQNLQAMIDGANLAGKAINITRTTAPHALSYAFTANHGIPHGHAIWLTLPGIFQAHVDCDPLDVSDPRGADHLRGIMHDLMRALGIEDPREAKLYLTNFVTELGLETDMQKLGVSSREQREFILSEVNLQRLNNNPVALTNSHLASLFFLDSDQT